MPLEGMDKWIQGPVHFVAKFQPDTLFHGNPHGEEGESRVVLAHAPAWVPGRLGIVTNVDLMGIVARFEDLGEEFNIGVIFPWSQVLYVESTFRKE